MDKNIFDKILEEYDYLRLSEVIYDKHNTCCYVVFLYPNYVEDLSEEIKNQIIKKLKSGLMLNANLCVKFKKSYLESSFIQRDIKTFLDENHISVGGQVKIDDLHVAVENAEIKINIILPSTLRDYFVESQIVQAIEKDISNRYFSRTLVTYEVINVEDRQDQIRDRILDEIYERQEIYTPRYKVTMPIKLIGEDISPDPECIKNVNKEKQLVILAGNVKEIKKKEYIKKTIKGDIVKHLYSFTLQDWTGEIQTTYFCSKTNEKKLDSLSDGASVLLMGDVRIGFRNKLVYYPKHISFCTQKPELQFIDEKKVEKNIVTNYKYVSPEPFYQTSQANLFTIQPQYNSYIRENNFVVFDVETTGLDPNYCEIIEIGAVKVTDGKVCEKFSVLLKPHNPISYKITEITGITNEMVEDCLFAEDVISDFFLFCKECILVGYNVGFDYSFIQNLAKNVGLDFTNSTFDVLELAKKQLHLKNYKLGTVVNSLGLELNNAHRAYWDAFATAEVFLKLNQIY